MRIVLITALFAVSALAQHRGGATASRVSRPAPAPVTRRPSYARSVVVAPYPVFISGYYGAPAYDTAYAAAPAPVAVVNPDFQPDAVNPQIVDYSNVPLPAPGDSTDQQPAVDDNGMKDDQPTIFLIALTDHTVVAAIAYWVDGDTLNWVSRDAKQNHMSLSLVDRDFSKQLNDERHVPFSLPPAK
jgi:hypothetical protein